MGFGMRVATANLSTFYFSGWVDFSLLRSLEAKNILRQVQVLPVRFTAFTSTFYGLFQYMQIKFQHALSRLFTLVQI